MEIVHVICKKSDFDRDRISLDATRIALNQVGNLFRDQKLTKNKQNNGEISRFRTVSKQKCIPCPTMH